MTLYNPTKLHQEIVAAGVPIDGCDSNGKVDYRPEATAVQIEQVEAPLVGIKALHNPNTLLPDDQDQADIATVQRYLWRQLFQPAPDVAAVKAQAQAYIGANSRLANAHANIAALYGFNTGTNAGYLQAALILIALPRL